MRRNSDIEEGYWIISLRSSICWLERLSFRERIWVDGELIPPDVLVPLPTVEMASEMLPGRVLWLRR